jgi:hypothetical protein
MTRMRHAAAAAIGAAIVLAFTWSGAPNPQAQGSAAPYYPDKWTWETRRP